MKEDILEQLVEDYLQHKGYFTRHNLKFKPRKDHPEFDSKQDSNASDIDVLGINPHENGCNRVWVVNCKSWQGGLNLAKIIQDLEKNRKLSGKAAWKTFRELTNLKWSEAFIAAVKEATGSDQFTYVTAVTKFKGKPPVWEKHQPFGVAMCGNPIRVLSLQEMLIELTSKSSTTVANSDLGRMLQLLAASGCKLQFERRAATKILAQNGNSPSYLIGDGPGNDPNTLCYVADLDQGFRYTNHTVPFQQHLRFGDFHDCENDPLLLERLLALPEAK
jgi:hypothetical protein